MSPPISGTCTFTLGPLGRDMTNAVFYYLGDYLPLLRFINRASLRIKCSRSSKSNFCLTLAKHGNTACLEWALRKGFIWSPEVCLIAASHGHVCVLEWALQKQLPIGMSRLHNTAKQFSRNGHLPVLKWIHERKIITGRGTFGSVVRSAAKGGHIDILTWGKQIDAGSMVSAQLLIAACKFNRVDVLDWLFDNDLTECKETGSKGPHLATMECFCFRRGKMCGWVALIGNLEALQWLRSKDFAWNEDTCAHAAKKGNMEILKWARENGCPWDTRVREHAVENCDTFMLEWARCNGAPWDDPVLPDQGGRE